MYKCCLFNCDGEWGTSHEFSYHLVDRKHFESFLIEIGQISSEKDVSELTFEQISEKVSEFSDPDFGQVETIRDEERWAIQKSRLATRPIGRIGRKSKNQVGQFSCFFGYDTKTYLTVKLIDLYIAISRY
jgi:hypothetical protein